MEGHSGGYLIMNQAERVEKIKKTSDFMVSSHAYLKEHYHFWTIIADTFLFLCALVLCVLAFADSSNLVKYFGNDFKFYIGMFSLITFIYSYALNRLMWKTRVIEHKIAFEKYFEIKKECEQILDRIKRGEVAGTEQLFCNYNALSGSVITVPEKLFNVCKKHHKLKVLISKHQDEHPATSLFVFKIKLWFRDNILN